MSARFPLADRYRRYLYFASDGALGQTNQSSSLGEPCWIEGSGNGRQGRPVVAGDRTLNAH
jgi:hypothetical protein